MDERSLWLPVAAAYELSSSPLAVRVMDVDLVLWQDAVGQVAAMADQCPHRGAKLSLGRVCEGQIECGYHGWRFDALGRCVLIPAVPDFAPTPSHAARTVASMLAQGLIWVQLANARPSDTAPPHGVAVAATRSVVCGPFDVHTSAPRVVENFLDTAHFGFVHAGYLGERSQAVVPDYALTQSSDGRPIVEHYRAWQPRASALAESGEWVDYRYEVLGPYAAVLHKQAAGGATDEAYALWVCPQSAERSRVWFTISTSNLAVSDAELIGFQATIFAQDQPVLESQSPRCLPIYPDAEVAEAHSRADRLSAAYRRYLVANGIRFGVC